MPGPSSAPLTLADVRRLITEDDRLTPLRRRELRCSLKRAGDLLYRDLAEIPADPVTLRQQFVSLHAAQTRIKPKRLASIRSDLTFALQQCGVPVLRRTRSGLSPRWRTLHRSLPTLGLKIGVSRFLRFCDEQSIEPENVTRSTSEAFKNALEQSSIVPNPRRVHKETCRLWNKAADTVPGWPRVRLPVPNYQRTSYCVRWRSLPASLRDETDRYMSWFGRVGFTRGRTASAVRAPATCARNRKQIHALVSALVNSGRDPDGLRSLSDIVAVEAVKEAMRYRLKQHKGRVTQYDRSIADTVIQIARDWLRVDGRHLDKLCHMRRQLGPQRHGLSERSRAALRQFNSEHNQRLILELPDKLMCEAIRDDQGSRGRAVTAQKAVAVELLLAAPMRIGNLVKLRTDQHLHWPSGSERLMYVTIPGCEVKNGHELAFALSRHTTDLIDQYLSRFRPRLVDGANPWLFPGVSGGHKNVFALSSQIQGTVFDWTGLRLTPGQFRHLVAKLIIDAEPGAYELVRLLLGHRRLQTTIWTYKAIEVGDGMARYDRILAGLCRRPWTCRRLGRIGAADIGVAEENDSTKALASPGS